MSPESVLIFDFILKLYEVNKGNWDALANEQGLDDVELRDFLSYVAVFLGNIGNYYGHGDQKLIPQSSVGFEKLRIASAETSALYARFEDGILSRFPSSLGFGSRVAQSAYYHGEPPLTKKELTELTPILESKSIEPENTRIRRTRPEKQCIYDVLQASTEEDVEAIILEDTADRAIRVVRGDHAAALREVCSCLRQARNYASRDIQKDVIDQYVASFQTGQMERFKEAQRLWIKDVRPTVESVFGFVEPYRDPFGVRAEFEGLAAIVDQEQTTKLVDLVENASTYIKRMPWAIGQVENDDKGPFEKELFEDPDFTSLHSKKRREHPLLSGIRCLC